MKSKNLKLPPDLVADIKTRLKTLSGQINGIVKMLEEGKDPEQLNPKNSLLGKKYGCKVLYLR